MGSDPGGIPKGDPPVRNRRVATEIFRPLGWGLAVLAVVAVVAVLVAPPLRPPAAQGGFAPPLAGRAAPAAPASPPVRESVATAPPLPPALQSRWDAEGPFHFTRGSPDLPYVSLTFDGDSHPGDVASILDVLGRASITATFFLTGDFVEKYPEATRAIGAAGHEVGSHLYRHVHLTTWEQNRRHDLTPGITRAALHDLLRRNEAAYRRATGGQMVRLWRAPFGETNPVLNAWAAELGYRHVAWTRDRARERSMDSLDWVSDPSEPRYLTAAQILDRLLSFDNGRAGGANGAIVLLHTGSLRRTERAWKILADFITGMRGRGYCFVSVSRLIELGLAGEGRAAAGESPRAP
jgi:peptidoglycan/xylan/chitin deacetylase (PgdA/CDA1 family)